MRTTDNDCGRSLYDWPWSSDGPDHRCRVSAEYDGPHREGEEPKPMVHGPEKSDLAIVAGKPANKAERSAAEPVEPRAETKGNAEQQSTCRAQNRISVSQALDCMRQALAVWTRGRSRMRESCTYGSVRGRSVMSVPTATVASWRPSDSKACGSSAPIRESRS